MGKTPEYTKNAIRNYQAGKDRVNLLLDYGTKERIKKRDNYTYLLTKH